MISGHKASALAIALQVNYKTFLAWVKEFDIPHDTKSGSKYFSDEGMKIAKFVKEHKDKGFGSEVIKNMISHEFSSFSDRLDRSQSILDGRNLAVDIQTVVTEAMRLSVSESWAFVEKYGEAMRRIGELESENATLREKLKKKS